MIDFYLYDKDGQIFMSGYCPADMVDLQKQPGYALGIGKADYKTHYVKQGELRLMPPKPSESHRFSIALEQWILDNSAAWASVRSKRDQLLKESDWTQLPDVPAATKESWATYRQLLRDVTTQTDPIRIVWPIPPQ